MYFQLYNKITDAIIILQKAQKDCEEVYIESDDTPITILQKEHPGEQET